MTKEELIAYISKDCDIPKTLAKEVLDSVSGNVAKCLRRKDKITLTGFGTFYVSKRKARTGRNPQTGATLQIKARNVPRFKAGKHLKNWVS
ncbi:MAG: HU family DNA-binding protein [Pseudomonadota bacterium]